jgi:hypothetical protein
VHTITHNQIFIQLIGFVALGIAFSVYQLNERKGMLRLQMWASLLFSIHFFLLGAYTGSVSGSLAYWQPVAKSIRLLALISPPAWFTYNFISHSYTGMATEIFLFTSILLGMYRLDVPVRRKKYARAH